ncbi:MAG: TetR/AcrR family transcriptional regulator [Nannocystis sp.]|nr:TetR/AcrR family transcriptional regulator [Nannocystis sp.]
MGRPKEFERDAVLDRAIEVFWDRGYDGTSMADLVEALGIGRQSLYDTFGDKRSLYLLALDRYRSERNTTPWHLLDEQPLRPGLRALFTAIVDWMADEPDGRSCMMVCAAAERAPHDREVERRFCANTEQMERRFTARLERARADGEIGGQHDVTALARYLTNALYGLNLTAKARRDRAYLHQIVDVTLSILG